MFDDYDGFGMIWVIDEHYSVQAILCGVSIERIFLDKGKDNFFGASVLGHEFNTFLFIINKFFCINRSSIHWEFST